MKTTEKERRKKIGKANRLKWANPEYKKKMIEIHKGLQAKEKHPLWGKRHSEEAKRKISETKKGSIPWNKGKKGVYTKERLKRMSEIAKGLQKNPEFRQKVSKSYFQKGHISWNKGIKMPALSIEMKRKLSVAQKRYYAENPDAIERLSGENSPAWKGGISKEPYAFEFDNELKEFIKARDNYQCQNPDCNGNSNKLTIHHINYDKKDFHHENLITLCNSCNAKANFKRETWQGIYSEIIKEISI